MNLWKKKDYSQDERTMFLSKENMLHGQIFCDQRFILYFILIIVFVDVDAVVLTEYLCFLFVWCSGWFTLIWTNWFVLHFKEMHAVRAIDFYECILHRVSIGRVYIYIYICSLIYSRSNVIHWSGRLIPFQYDGVKYTW